MENKQSLSGCIASNNAHLHLKPRRFEPLSVKSFDPEVIHCLICSQLFTVPVFQCQNGHTACSSCCHVLSQKCPSCSLPIGTIRCRAIETVLESVEFYCRNVKNGCKETFAYRNINEHDKICAYAPCSCPMPGCKFISGSELLYTHCSMEHAGCLVRFKFDQPFTISFSIYDNFVLLQEESEGIVFVLKIGTEFNSFVITVIRLGPSSSKEGCFYDLIGKIEGTSHTFRSFTKNVQSKFDGGLFPSVGLLLNPIDFVDDDGNVSLDLCIWHSVSSSVNIHKQSQ